MLAGGMQVGDTSPALNLAYELTTKQAFFTVQGLKQTENYKVHKRIFHTAEPCKVFTLEFPFWNLLSQDSICFGMPGQLSCKCVLLWLEVPGDEGQRVQALKTCLAVCNVFTIYPSLAIVFGKHGTRWKTLFGDTFLTICFSGIILESLLYSY